MKHEELFRKWTKQLKEWNARQPPPNRDRATERSTSEPTQTHYYCRQTRRVRPILPPPPPLWVMLVYLGIFVAIFAAPIAWEFFKPPTVVKLCEVGGECREL